MMMYLLTIVMHPHGHWQLQELLANGSLYPGTRCKGRDFTSIRQGGAHREGSLYPGVCCVGGSLYTGFTVHTYRRTGYY